MEPIYVNYSEPLKDDLDDYLEILDTKPKKKKFIINRKPKESDTILTLATKCYNGVWGDLFDIAYDELKEISDHLENKEYLPLKKNIFRIFNVLKLSDVKVVILGQDPYHQILDNGEPRAKGLSFSVSRDDEIPSSLKNIFKEIRSNYPDIPSFTHGDLTYWVEQGVLLLNTALTVKPNDAGSHTRIWKSFTNYVFEKLSKSNNKIVYMLWGNHAKSFKSLIRSKNCLILTSAHPSATKGFFGNKHFIKCNDFLNEPIDWSLP